MRGTLKVEAKSGGRPLSRRRWLSPVMRILNVVPKIVLRSPLHGLMDGDLMLLGFEGRASGRRYVVPVSYVEDEGTLLIGTDRPWRKNIRTGDWLSGWLTGRERQFLAEIVSEENETAKLFRTILPKNPALGRFLDIELDADGCPNRGDLQRAVGRGVAVIRLHPQ